MGTLVYECAYECKSTYHVHAWYFQRMGSTFDSLELKLQIVVSHHIGVWIRPRSSVRPGSSLNPWAIFPAHELFLSKCQIYRTVLLTLVIMGYARSWIYLFIEKISTPHPISCNLLPCSVFLHSTCVAPQISGNSLICLGDAVSRCKILYKNASPCPWKYSHNHVCIFSGARFIIPVGVFIKRLVKHTLNVYHLESCTIPESSMINTPSSSQSLHASI